MKRRPMRKAKQAECPAWMMTFGDCMSLLVTFFVMLIAFSTMEEYKLFELIGAMRGALGAAERQYYIDTPIESHVLHRLLGEAAEERFLTLEEMTRLAPLFMDEFQEELAARQALPPDHFIIQMLEEGLVVILRTQSLFKDGSPEWASDFSPLWRGIGWLLRGHPSKIRITACLTSDSPVLVDTAQTVWGLGIQQAEAVASELEQAMQVSPSRFTVGVQVFDARPGQEASDHVEITIMSEDTLRIVDAEDFWNNGNWR